MTTTAIQLVQTHGQQAFTTSLAIATYIPVERKNKQTGVVEEYERDHKDVIALIRKYQSDFEEFGQLTFETAVVSAKGAGQATEYAVLSEDQATYLVTLFTNSASVRKFKIRLVKEFRKALDHIAENFKDPPRTGLIADKRASHWDMTAALKEIRAEVGKDTKAYHYATENKLLNWCICGEFKPLDESSLSNEEVELLRKVRIKDAAYIRADMDYAERKEKLKAYADRLRALKLMP